jgi:predicted ATPase
MFTFTKTRLIASLVRAHIVHRTPTAAVIKRSVATNAVKFDWEDPLLLKEHLIEEELAISQTARDYCQEKLLPRITGVCSTLRSFNRATA